MTAVVVSRTKQFRLRDFGGVVQRMMKVLSGYVMEGGMNGMYNGCVEYQGKVAVWK